ncbi:MAG: LacI family transcriptional regulator [Gammaproteobacteria bacterium]|nr:LacI family transcriptional regulator [Gammaproteobacteria bacterium]
MTQARALRSASFFTFKVADFLRSVTIKDIALAAGVSIKTVSRVLNREPYVRDTIRERVWQLVEQFEYQPHPAARSLGGRRTYSIGLILEVPETYSYVKRLIDGVFDVCETRRYSLLLRPGHEALKAAEVKKYVRQTRVDGVILPAPIGDSEEVTRTLTEMEVPFAQLSPRNIRADWMSARPNDEAACRELLHEIYALGHRRVGFIKGLRGHGSTVRRLQGYWDSVNELGFDIDPNLVVDGAFDFESGHAGAMALLNLQEPPTVIVASNDDMAHGAIVAARERNLSVPNDLSVVGFDDSPVAKQTFPSLTTMRQPIYEMAQALTNMLLDKLHGLDIQEKVREYSCELIRRDSLKALA